MLLAAIFGRWMGYLVLMVAFSGWMIMLSAIWRSASAPRAPTPDEPRAARRRSPAGWSLEAGSTSPQRPLSTTFAAYPEATRGREPGPDDEDIAPRSQSVSSGRRPTFLAEQANEELGREEADPDAIRHRVHGRRRALRDGADDDALAVARRTSPAADRS